MTSVTVRIPTPLRSLAGGVDEVRVQGITVGEALRALDDALLERILTPEGEVRRFVNIYLGPKNIRGLDGLATPITEGDVLSIIPAVAGGSGTKVSDRRLAELRAQIPEVTPREALTLQRQGAVLVDVREPDEIAAGMPAGALPLGRSYLEVNIEDAVPNTERTLVVLCAVGQRSLFAAEGLRRLGYSDVRNLAGGFNRWKNEGIPFEIPRTLDADARERYSRHLLMPEVGESGQLRLLDGKVLLIGAGGLGSPAALYLAAAGIGTLGIVDHDRVDRSNLQRQILHADARVGESKVASATEAIQALNPSVKVMGHEARLESANVEEILSSYEVVVDGSDNFATRYLINDACVKLGIPNVHGSVYRFEGQVSVFWPAYEKRPTPCYRCLYPQPPPPELAPSCAEAGVLGILPGVIGLLEAVETIKILLGVGDLLVGRLLYYDALRAEFRELQLDRNPECPYCADPAQFPGYVDYEAFCAAASA
ncbi:MAG: molybdopterin-synthase adenylyltransferase MoeB [Pseudomonadota bacterium]|nr:molybdopterin-synthase adenylyltransferase MoeB [Pseudomonadota bacterium]